MKLSICIVTYNQERFIEQCVISALNQTVSFDYEIVVGEDCSTDGTRAILERLAAAHPSILKIRHREVNLGAERNFDKTITECSGEYIAFLEGDNWWTSPDKLQRQVEMLDAHPDMSFCFHRTRYVDAAGRPLPTVMPPEDPPAETGFEFLMQESNPVALGSVVARAALLGGWQDWLGGLKLGDWPLCLMLGARGRVGFVAQDMSVQRVHAGGAWSFLSPPTQVMYVLQMLDRIAPLLDDAQRQMLVVQRTRLIGWWTKQMVYEPPAQAEKVLDDLRRLNDAAFETKLLTEFTRNARAEFRDLRAAQIPKSEVDIPMTNVDEVLRTELSALQHIVQKFVVDRNEALNRTVDLEMQLARARGRPLKVMRDFLRFQILSALSRQTSIVPERMSERFGKSARKRDPNRSTTGWAEANFAANVTLRNLEPAKLGKDGSIRYSGGVKADPVRRTILIVSHEASRTGAPILALNLVTALAERYNVVTLGLRGGNILSSFRAVSTDVYVAETFHHDPLQYMGLIQSLCTKYDFAFAVVNSLESRAVLRPLNEAGTPIVTLVHEFAAYTSPITAFQDVSTWSTETIFSTRVTMENALLEAGLEDAGTIHVAAQGKCIVPMQAASDLERESERAWLTQALRPKGTGARRFVVIGAGAIQIRKGVDLFIECATRVLQAEGTGHVRFAWIGHGYDPKGDMGYSVYLRDQIRRAGLEDRVQMLRETSDIELAYELADLFLLPSRLDPLPNVAIDALSVGLPVLCFDRTTGIADFLSEAGLGDQCVAAYLDSHDLAAKITALVQSDTLRSEISAKSRALAATAFNMADYVAKVEGIALAAERKVRANAAR